MTPNLDLQFINKESGNSMTTANSKVPDCCHIGASLGISPAYLKEDISLQDNASHQTRSVTSLSCQTPRVNSFGLKSFFYTAIKSWNSLPFSLRSINMKQSFKNILKTSIWNQLRSENQELYIYY